MAGKSIVIVEDEPDMAALIAGRLRKEYYGVTVAYDGVAGLGAVRSGRPDLVLLDVMLPRMSGIEVLKEIRGDPHTAGTPVIMLTARTEEGDVVAGLQLGADDYVTKPFSMSVLVARVEAVLRRKTGVGLEETILTVGDVRINRDTHEVTVAEQLVPLTLTEFRILVAIVAARGRVLTRGQLIDHGIGPDAVVTDRTIDVHLASLRAKLGAARKLIKTVRGVGYSLATECDETT